MSDPLMENFDIYANEAKEAVQESLDEWADRLTPGKVDFEYQIILRGLSRSQKLPRHEFSFQPGS